MGVMDSLSTGQVKILNSSDEGKRCSKTTEFSVNMDFKSALYRLKVNAVQAKETVIDCLHRKPEESPSHFSDNRNKNRSRQPRKCLWIGSMQWMPCW